MSLLGCFIFAERNMGRLKLKYWSYHTDQHTLQNLTLYVIFYSIILCGFDDTISSLEDLMSDHVTVVYGTISDRLMPNARQF